MSTKTTALLRPEITEVKAAQRFLSQYLQPTRLIHAPSLSRLEGRKVYLKLETELPTASFKVRGAIFALAVNLKNREIHEVVACSPVITALQWHMQRNYSE